MKSILNFFTISCFFLISIIYSSVSIAQSSEGIEEIVEKINKHSTDLVIITGGEPFYHDLGPLTSMLKENNKLVHVETSGTEKYSGEFDWICLSPKRFKKPPIEPGVVFSESAAIVATLWHYIGVGVVCFGIGKPNEAKSFLELI